MSQKKRPSLSPLESHVLRIVAAHQAATADDVRRLLAPDRVLKDSTVRTLLRRLERKGYVRHSVQGRVYSYSPSVSFKEVSAGAIRSVLDRFFEGSAEDLIVGMVDDRLLTAEKLKRLAEQIAEAESRERKQKRDRQEKR
jgi:BlaI family transcriptional regulator, penicillinase repressor